MNIQQNSSRLHIFVAKTPIFNYFDEKCCSAIRWRLVFGVFPNVQAEK